MQPSEENKAKKMRHVRLGISAMFNEALALPVLNESALPLSFGAHA